MKARLETRVSNNSERLRTGPDVEVWNCSVVSGLRPRLVVFSIEKYLRPSTDTSCARITRWPRPVGCKRYTVRQWYEEDKPPQGKATAVGPPHHYASSLSPFPPPFGFLFLSVSNSSRWRRFCFNI